METGRLREYAKLAVQTGSNVQKGQLLVISAPVEAQKFVHLCVEEAFAYGAGEVEVKWYDDYITKKVYENVETSVLKQVPEYKVLEKKYQVDKGCAYLNIRAETPGNLKDIDSSKLQEVNAELLKALEPYRYYTMSNIGQWTIIAYPTVAWAKAVFPNLDENEGVEALWEAILKASRVTVGSDPNENWKEHNAKIKVASSTMNQHRFKTLHFTNGLGTDLMLDLVPNHIWAGGQDKTPKGVTFNPNIPTEEVFTMPRRTGVNGVVHGTKPLNYQGKLVENFMIRFENGKAVDCKAEKEESALRNLIELDEGSCYLGEVALISHYSPISEMDILFYLTLFDENASCHLALGAAYPSNLQGGLEMTKEELVKNDANVSKTHVDFMFGSADMNIVGIKENGEKVQVFKDGTFCI